MLYIIYIIYYILYIYDSGVRFLAHWQEPQCVEPGQYGQWEALAGGDGATIPETGAANRHLLTISMWMSMMSYPLVI